MLEFPLFGIQLLNAGHQFLLMRWVFNAIFHLHFVLFLETSKVFLQLSTAQHQWDYFLVLRRFIAGLALEVARLLNNWLDDRGLMRFVLNAVPLHCWPACAEILALTVGFLHLHWFLELQMLNDRLKLGHSCESLLESGDVPLLGCEFLIVGLNDCIDVG